MFLRIDRKTHAVLASNLPLQPADDASSYGVAVVPGPYVWSPALRAFEKVLTIAEEEARLIGLVKAESERRRMLIYTPSRGKMKEYQAKKQEVLDFRALTQVAGTATAALNAALSVFNVTLDAPARQRKFPFAMAEAALRGETVAQVIGRYETGIATSDGAVAVLAAIEQKAATDIRAAKTIATKRAVYAAIVWPA